METEGKLIAETQKWLKKIEARKMVPLTDKGKEFKANIEAYIKDSRHFLEKKDYVHAFEAIVWAWAFLEISIDLKMIELEDYAGKPER